MSIFLTTHYMEEANEADYIVVIDKGKIVAKGSPLELKTTYSKDLLFLYSKNLKKLEKKLTDCNIVFNKSKEKITISINKTVDALNILNDCRGFFDSFEVIKASLDDVFISITKEEVK